MKGTNVNVVEIAPPYVDTGLDAEHRERVNEMGLGGEPPMELGKYMDATMEKLEKGKAEELREVGVGFSDVGIQTWRGSFGKALGGMGIDA